MPSDVFRGILSGLGSAYQEHHANILNMEQERRKQLGDFLSTEMHNPNRTPESQQELQQHWLTLNSTPFDKKLSNDFKESLLHSITSVKSQPGQPSSSPSETMSAPPPVPGNGSGYFLPAQDTSSDPSQAQPQFVPGDYQAHQAGGMPSSYSPAQAPANNAPSAPQAPGSVGSLGQPSPSATIQAPAIPSSFPAMYTPDQQSQMQANAAGEKESAIARAKAPFTPPQLDVRPFGPDSSGLYEATTGNVIVHPGAGKKNYEMKSGTVDGKPITAYFDPQTHSTFDLQGNDISTKFAPVEPNTPQATEDEKINQLKIKVDKGTATADDKKELSSRMATKLAGVNQSNANMTVRQATAADRKEVTTKYNDLAAARALLRSMNDAITRINSGKSKAIGADDMILLSNHIAMTMGQVKGARTGQQLIDAHKQARDLPSELQTIVDGWTKGSQLSAGQREEFVHAAQDRLNGYQSDYGDAKSVYQWAPPGDKEGIPSSAPTPPPGGNTGTGSIQMRAPDGTTQSVPSDQVEHYKALGAVVVQ